MSPGLMVRHVGAVRPPAVLAIGASTGGPQALVALLCRAAPVLRDDAMTSIPVCVTLHMPRDLMPVIAAHVARRCAVATCIVEEPCRLRRGCIYFAPGDRNLGCEGKGDEVILMPVGLPPGPTALPAAPSPRRRSAVDAMFASVATTFGARALAVVLSGMGEDGLAGSRAIVERGGAVLAQDRGSSAVWGMPGAVVQAGLASRVLSPPALAAEVVARCGVARLDPVQPSLPVEDARADRRPAEVRR